MIINISPWAAAKDTARQAVTDAGTAKALVLKITEAHVALLKEYIATLTK